MTFIYYLGDATILEESEKVKAEPFKSTEKGKTKKQKKKHIFIQVFFPFFLESSAIHKARQIRSRTGNDDDQMETNNRDLVVA